MRLVRKRLLDVSGNGCAHDDGEDARTHKELYAHMHDWDEWAIGGTIPMGGIGSSRVYLTNAW